MKSLSLVLFLFLSFNALGDSVRKCTMGSFEYSGKAFSETYSMTPVKGEMSCQARDQIDEESLKKNFEKNQQEIDQVIGEILNDESCKDTWAFIKEYQCRIVKSSDLFSSYTKERIEIVQGLVKELDIQYGFAYLGAFNSTCVGGQNRKNAFINLDLINKIPDSAPETERVSKNGEVVKSCGDVEAQGSDDLKNFKVSTKEATGRDFQLMFDPFGIPDRVTVRGAGGNIIYDSQCKGNADGIEGFQKIPLEQTQGMVSIEVQNNCSDPNGEKGVSHWVFRLQCVTAEVNKCQDKKKRLVALLKNKVLLLKELMDASSLQRECYFYLEKDVLTDLLESDLIGLEDAPLRNGSCETGDEICEERLAREKSLDSKRSLLPLRDPSSEQDHFRCPQSSEEETIFDKLSRSYCQVGWRRLGVESEVKDLK